MVLEQISLTNKLLYSSFEDRNIISYGAAISACERAEKWQLAVSLLNDLLSNLQGWEMGNGNLQDLGGCNGMSHLVLFFV